MLNNYSAWDSPTVSFGGSLAGTLAALMRVRYPHLIDMAWASSTPLCEPRHSNQPVPTQTKGRENRTDRVVLAVKHTPRFVVTDPGRIHYALPGSDTLGCVRNSRGVNKSLTTLRHSRPGAPTSCARGSVASAGLTARSFPRRSLCVSHQVSSSGTTSSK